MLRACVIDFKVNWDDYLTFIELPKTIVITQAFSWLCLKQFMVRGVNLWWVGLKWVSFLLLARI